MTELAGVEAPVRGVDFVHLLLPHSDRQVVAVWLLEHADHPWDVVSTSDGFAIPPSLFDKPSGHGDLTVGSFLLDEHGALVPDRGDRELAAPAEELAVDAAPVPAAVEEPVADPAPATRKKQNGKG